MEYIAFLGLIVCAPALLLVGYGCAVFASMLITFETAIARRIFFGTVFFGACIGIWLVPNLEGIHDQMEMKRLSADCGWKQFKQVQNVEGVYSEPLIGSPADAGVNYYLNDYPSVEYPGYKGEIYRASSESPGEKATQLEQRSYRYGFKATLEHLTKGIDRLKDTVYDFDGHEVLAENTSYSFKRNDHDSLKGIFFYLVSFHRYGCGEMLGDAWRERYTSVLRPKSRLLPEQYAAIENHVATEVPLEVLVSEPFNPSKTMTNEEWSRLAFDKMRGANCADLIRQEYPGSRFSIFLKDATLKNRAPSNPGFAMCESNQIWIGDYVDRTDTNNFTNGKKMLLSKYTQDGRLIYKIKFTKPDNYKFYYGGIMDPTFHAQSGYLYFEWLNLNRDADGVKISRRIEARVLEPTVSE